MGRENQSAPTATKPQKKRRRKQTRSGHTKARHSLRGAWTLNDPCLYCKFPGPHRAEPSNNGALKATCGKCGKYQKFVSEHQASASKNALLDALKSRPVTNRAFNVIGVCRDCGASEERSKREFRHASPPRCVACGGQLEATGAR